MTATSERTETLGARGGGIGGADRVEPACRSARRPLRSRRRRRSRRLVVTDLLNVRYLTGFPGGAGTLVVTPDRCTLVTDGRYGVTAAETARLGVTVEVADDDGSAAVTAAAGDARRIGLEADAVSWSRQRTFAEDWFAGRAVLPTVRLVEGLRFVKDAGELARARRRARRRGVGRDRSTARHRRHRVRAQQPRRADGRSRSEQPAFPTIVASGPNGALPHHRLSARTIEQGDAVLIDFGGTVDGYRSDISRTFLVGEVAPLEEFYDIVLRAQLAARRRRRRCRRCRRRSRRGQ